MYVHMYVMTKLLVVNKLSCFYIYPHLNTSVHNNYIQLKLDIHVIIIIMYLVYITSSVINLIG